MLAKKIGRCVTHVKVCVRRRKTKEEQALPQLSKLFSFNWTTPFCVVIYGRKYVSEIMKCKWTFKMASLMLNPPSIACVESRYDKKPVSSFIHELFEKTKKFIDNCLLSLILKIVNISWLVIDRGNPKASSDRFIQFRWFAQYFSTLKFSSVTGH